MHALLRKGNGQCYVSPVFGFYRDSQAINENQSLEMCAIFYVVWNEERTELIKWYIHQREGSTFLR